MAKESVCLVDGSALCYRAFYSLRLSNSKGFPTGAIYGFYQNVKRLIQQRNPRYMAVCFDVSRKTFRKERYDDYKSQRLETPNDLIVQFPVIRKMISLTGIAMVEKEGYEADDIIASLADKSLRNNMQAVIVSYDKDMYQLLADERIVIYNPFSNAEEIITEETFSKKFGFRPQFMVDYLALAGDASDNIPGAAGIGEKGAKKLIEEFSTVENIFNHLDDVSPAVRSRLKQSRENIFLSKELVVLHRCDLDVSMEDLHIKEANNRELYDLFRELEFKSLLKDVSISSPAAEIEVKQQFTEDFFGKVKKNRRIALMTGDGNVYVSIDEKKVLKIPQDYLNRLLKDGEVVKITYDLKSQLPKIKTELLNDQWFDIRLAAYVLDPGSTDYTLSGIIAEYLNQHICDLSNEAAVCFIYNLYEILAPILDKEGLKDLFFNVEMPLIEVLSEMELAGVRIDVREMNTLLSEVEKSLAKIREEIFSIAGKEFNLNSPKQLGDVLFKDLRIRPLKKTKTGYSTGEEVLEKLAHQHMIARLLLEYRQLNKLESAYLTPFIEQVKQQGGKIHANFNQMITQTGRLSSSSPNLQNIPAKGELSVRFRKAFVTSWEKGLLLSADYSQIELRILAHFSQDKRLTEAFLNNMDIHAFTASLLFNIPEQKVTPEQRNIAKRVNFGIIYGMSSYGLSKELGIIPSEAELFINEYFLRYPEVNNYIQKLYREVEQTGCVRTILGRKRKLPDFNNSNQQLRDFARRQAVNTPIQGSCADIIKLAMVNIYKEFKKRNLKTKLIIQIHDDLIFDVPQDESQEVMAIVKSNMEQCISLNVPLKVNIKTGKNWAQMEEVV